MQKHTQELEAPESTPGESVGLERAELKLTQRGADQQTERASADRLEALLRRRYTSAEFREELRQIGAEGDGTEPHERLQLLLLLGASTIVRHTHGARFGAIRRALEEPGADPALERRIERAARLLRRLVAAGVRARRERLQSAMLAMPPLPSGLTKPPCAVTRFTDLRRKKGFTDLHYRVRNTTRGNALGFIEDVLADLERADVPHRGAVTITLTPAEKGWTVHMDVPVGEQG